MSTKTTVFTILAVVGAALGVFAKALGLALDPVKLLAGVAGILVYVFGSLKTDAAAIDQPLVWKDPKVYLAAVQAALAALTSAGIVLPISPELIIAVLTAIMGVLFKPAQIARAMKARRKAMAGAYANAEAEEALPTVGIIVVAVATVAALIWFISLLTS